MDACSVGRVLCCIERNWLINFDHLFFIDNIVFLIESDDC